jgi:hypothetical protein
MPGLTGFNLSFFDKFPYLCALKIGELCLLVEEVILQQAQ